MHVPSRYKIDDIAEVEQLIRENSFAILVSETGGFPMATHIPIELETASDGERVLRGHVSKLNPHWKVFRDNPKALVIFQSPTHHYISSSWYERPNAPTWNYTSVHVYGSLRIIEGQELFNALRDLTARYEKIAKNPMSLDTAPPDVINQIDGVVGFEITIEKVEAARKMSQNRTAKDYENVIRELRALGTANALRMADEMEAHKPKS